MPPKRTLRDSNLNGGEAVLINGAAFFFVRAEAMTEAESNQLVTEVVQSFWRRYQRPVLGSRLKAELLARAGERGDVFDEHELGYKSFSAYLGQHTEISVTSRPGSDFLVSPATVSGHVHSGEAAWIRPDFWRAFVTFGLPDEVRAYDRARDVVYRGSAADAPLETVVITPIPKDAQVTWRKGFLESLEDKDRPHVDLGGETAFRDFSNAVRRDQNLSRAWNVFLSGHVADYIRNWSRTNEIPEDRWLKRGEKEKTDVRKEIYALLDDLSVEELLELRIPIRHLIGRRME